MKRPVTITIAAILTLVMILVSAVWPIAGVDRLLGINSFGRVSGMYRAQGSLRSGNFPSGNQSGGNSFQRYAPGQNGSAPTLRGTPPAGGFQNFRSGYAGQIGNRGRNTGWLIYLQYILEGLEIVLGIAAIVGLWMNKRWGKILAVITAGVVVLGVLPQLFRMMFAASVIENVVRVLLAAAVILLVALTKTKPVKPAAQ